MSIAQFQMNFSLIWKTRKEYYNCSKTLLITTSSYSKQAHTLAEKTGVELWSWRHLNKFLCDTYLDGKSHYEFFKTNDVKEKETVFTCKVTKIQESSMKGDNYNTYNIVHVDIKNNSKKHQEVTLGLPTLITSNNMQIESINYLTGSFMSGKIYSDCTVNSGFWFTRNQIKYINNGDKIILQINTNSKQYELIERINLAPNLLPHNPNLPGTHTQPNKPATSPSWCFIATAAYGTPMAKDIDILRGWRDNSLNMKNYGRKAVFAYYKISPPIANFIAKNNTRRYLTRILLKPIIKIIKMKNITESR